MKARKLAYTSLSFKNSSQLYPGPPFNKGRDEKTREGLNKVRNRWEREELGLKESKG
jgi:hypothetical protein